MVDVLFLIYYYRDLQISYILYDVLLQVSEEGQKNS